MLATTSKPLCSLLFLAMAFLGCSPLVDAAMPNQQVVDVFEKTVRPLLVRHCYECHGPDAGRGEANLRLDSLAAILKGGDSGPAVVPGKPLQSLMIHAVSHEPSVTAMPPERRLASAEVAAITRWVQLKGPWNVKGLADFPSRPKNKTFQITQQDRAFWAFQPPRMPELPHVKNREWVRNPIDQFVLAKLDAAGHAAPALADGRTLIRRATYDLHGLPPTPAEVECFLHDRSPNAVERLVDRLLMSPRYGEKWGRHWLDVARYSDSNGMDDNIAFADAWRYRDYVIESFNRDLPYDQFVREQIAGDLIEPWNSPRRAAAVVATTFLMLGQKQPSADDPVKQELDIVDEQIDTISRAFLAMTVACSRCHDHKFDPFSQRDYYALAGILRSTTSMLSFRVDAKFNLTALTSQSDNDLLSQLEQQMDRHDDVLVNGNKTAMSADERKGHSDKLNVAFARMEKIPTAMAVKDGRVADMPLLHRGNHLTPRQLVRRGVPIIFSESGRLPITSGESGRRELAAWLASPSNPLTARVMVNRVWHWHMGSGIVPSLDNFGRLGQRPENPELLDWLAIQFIESGWSIKQLHRLIMTSAVYQSQTNPRRLAAEELRDSLLALSDQLDRAMGGKTLPIRNHKIMSGDEIAKCNAVHKQPRRTVYLPVIRSGLEEFLTTFDFPDPSVPTGKRVTTTVAPQALYMLNSPLMRKSSQAIAARVRGSAPDAEGRTRYAYNLILARSAKDNEIRLWKSFLQSRDNPQSWESLVRVLLSSNDFMYVK